MERSALSHLKRAPSINIHRGSLHILPPSHLTAVRHPICGGSRRNLFFCPDAEVAASLAKPLWIGCKRSPSGQIHAQPEPDGPTPPQSFPLDMNLVEAFRQPPEVTAIAPKLETWPVAGYTATKFDPTVARKFFNREDELKFIKKKLARRRNPEKVILLLGPRSCGKTALIEELMKENQERFLHLNCGLETVTTSGEMAQALRARSSKFALALGIVLRTIPLASNLAPMMGVPAQVDGNALAAPSEAYDQAMELLSESKDNTLTYVVNWYKQVLLKATPQQTPVFIIDEVNKLKEWRKTPAEETNLKNLLDFLRRICKEQNKAHVLLATSDLFMVSWLEKNGFATDSRLDVVLGELTREEALRFVVGGKDSSGKDWPGQMNAFEELPPLHKEDWEKAWAMCGGNIKLLRICVDDADVYGDWEKAVESVGAASARNVDDAWLYAETFAQEQGLEARLWTSEDYQIAVGLIADAAPYYAVPEIVIAAELEKDGRLLTRGVTGIKVLYSTIEYNVLSVRPYSDMAKDIPREAFFRMVKRKKGLVEKKNPVVVMPSPAHLFAALKNLD